MSAPAPAAKHRPPVVDGKLWKACRLLYLRDGSQIGVRSVVHVDAHHIVIVPVDSDDLVLVPKHAVDRALLDRSRFARGGES